MMLSYYMHSISIDYMCDCMSLCHYVPGAHTSTRGTEHTKLYPGHTKCTRGTGMYPGHRNCTRGTGAQNCTRGTRIVPGGHDFSLPNTTTTGRSNMAILACWIAD